MEEASAHRDHSKIGIAIIGFPYDEGTVINGERPGGKNASKTVREHVYKIGCVPNAEMNIDYILIYKYLI